MEKQAVFRGESGYHEFEDYLLAKGRSGIFLVCGKSFHSTQAGSFFKDLEQCTDVRVVLFSGFSPNPDYEEVAAGVREFRSSGCGLIVGAGGGSAMDTAKCVKLFAQMNGDKDYTEQPFVPNDIPLAVIPTTAGTGSEATRYAVIYHNGEKLSVTHESCIPEAVLLDHRLLRTLPGLHRKCAMLDALCHGIESFWSVNSTSESRELSVQAIRLLLDNMENYLSGDDSAAANILEAAFIAGKAINITATTAGHAMSYKLTSLYGMPHGHAAALCTAADYRFMLDYPEKCSDPRGGEYLMKRLQELAGILGFSDTERAVEYLAALPESLGLTLPDKADVTDIPLLAASVNAGRLKNNPVQPDRADLERLYADILGGRL